MPIPKQGPCIVLFTAKDCQPCKRIIPMLGKLAIASRIIDCQQHPRIAARYSIQSTPTLLLLRDGQAVRQSSKAMTPKELEAWIVGM
jgi:thioredoxin 2